jgi:hypothetical protein
MVNKNIYFSVCNELKKETPSNELLNIYIMESGNIDAWKKIITKYLLSRKSTKTTDDRKQEEWNDLIFNNIYNHLGDEEFNIILFDILKREEGFATQKFIISCWIEKWEYFNLLFDEIRDLCKECIKKFMQMAGKCIPEIVEAYLCNNISLNSITNEINYTEFDGNSDIIYTLNYIYKNQILFKKDNYKLFKEKIYHLMAVIFPSEKLVEQITGGMSYETLLKEAIKYLYRLDRFDNICIMKLRGYDKVRNKVLNGLINDDELELMINVIEEELVDKVS